MTFWPFIAGVAFSFAVCVSTIWLVVAISLSKNRNERAKMRDATQLAVMVIQRHQPSAQELLRKAGVTDADPGAARRVQT